MNLIAQTLTLIFFFALGLQGFGETAKTQNIDPDVVDVLVAGMTVKNVTVVYSIFPEKGKYVKRLTKSGESIYSHPEMLSSWPLFQVHDVKHLIRGTCYDYLFLTYGQFSDQGRYPFMEGGEYILLLKPSLDQDGNIITDQIDPSLFDDVSKFSFLNHNTLFDIYYVNGRASVIGLSVVDGKRDPMHVPNEGIKLVDDLSLISEFLHNGGNDIELPNLFDNLKSKYGVQVAIKIFGVPKSLNPLPSIEAPLEELYAENRAPLVPEIKETVQEFIALKTANEEPVEAVTSKPAEKPEEQSSKWWLWLIGAVVLIGGLSFALRRKS